MNSVLKRELQVAFSLKTQPLAVRIVKWTIIIFLYFRFHNAPYFWSYVGLAFILGFILHFFYRYKTRGWTQSWGGWAFH